MDYQSQPNVPQMGQTNKTKWIIIGIVALVVIAAVVWYLMGGKNGKVLGASTTSTYQAVFLTNGQVYFGKLTGENSDWITLSDIYYLQVTQNLQNATGGNANTQTSSTGTADNNQPNIQLVKLGSELHGPTDTMHIERDKVLFWEDMKSDSKVVQAINSYKNK